MLRTNIILISALVIAAVVGYTLADDPYRLSTHGHPIDQVALDHRDSPYSHITWVISEGHNYAELRFFDKVEGGVCLRPTWAELAEFNDDGALDHVLMPEGFDLSGARPHRSWPAGREKPNPGTLTKSPYVTLMPAGILLNNRLMREAGNDPRRATPNILMVGLGSGVGVSLLAHHFPEASIAVVDIDAAVIDMVVDHYPFLRWLRDQQTSDGRPRLKMGDREAIDARQYIKHPVLRDDDGRLYDMVIIDAFTDGSTIPPHLMTREFFQEVRALMPEDGIVLSNIIGSYSGAQHRIVGGAMHAQRMAGLVHAHNFPLLRVARQFQGTDPRNNIMLTSAVPIGPLDNAAAWTRLASFVPYQELPLQRFQSHLITVRHGNLPTSVSIPVPADDREILPRLQRASSSSSDIAYVWQRIDDRPFIDTMRDWVLARHPRADGWQQVSTSAAVEYVSYDWVHHARTTWAVSIAESRRSLPGRVLVHSGDTLIGSDGRGGTIPRVPVFTDSRPNADIFNR